jgi:alpha-tubulin suppressor-like RCC1 family protein
MRIGSARGRNAGFVAAIVVLAGAAACTSILGNPPAGSLAADGGGGGDGTGDDGPGGQEGGMDGTTMEGSTDSPTGDGPSNDGMVGLDEGPPDGGHDPIVSLTTGAAACVVKQSGALWCWGNNQYGTIGDGTMMDRAVPVHITKDSTGATLPPMAQVSAGLEHTCAVSKSNTVYCWGTDDAGALGDGITLPIDAGSANRLAPHLVPNLQATQVGAGYFHTCSIMGAKITCWGSNGNGELGHQPGTMGDVSITNAFFYDYANSTPTTNITLYQPAQLSLGGMFGCTNDTSAQDPFCWGDNYSAQLGQGAPDGGTYSWTPLEVSVAGNATLGLQKEIASSSFNHGCAVSGQGALSCWGDNGAGQLGTSLPVATGNDSVAFTVMATGVGHVSVGVWTTCIVDVSQHVQCWGANQGGVLGHDPATDPLSSCPGSSTPCNPNASTITLNGSPFGPVLSLSVGVAYACAIKTDGTLWCWGQSGELGSGAGDDAGMIYEPAQVSGLP